MNVFSLNPEQSINIINQISSFPPFFPPILIDTSVTVQPQYTATVWLIFLTCVMLGACSLSQSWCIIYDWKQECNSATHYSSYTFWESMAMFRTGPSLRKREYWDMMKTPSLVWRTLSILPWSVEIKKKMLWIYCMLKSVHLFCFSVLALVLLSNVFYKWIYLGQLPSWRRLQGQRENGRPAF